MSGVWATIAALAVATAMIKAAGPLLAGGRTLPRPATAVIALLAPALLAALVATETFTTADHLALDARTAGVAVSAVALALRAPLLLVVGLAAASAAGVRLLA